FFMLIESSGHGVYDVIGHGAVDFSGKLNEAGAKVPFLGFPGKVERIDRNTVSAKSRSGIERLEAEWFGRSGADDLPYVDAHAQAEHLELIDQSDIHAAINIL